MSKESEAFREVREYLNYVLYENAGSRAMACTSTSQYLEPYIATIEQALKRLEGYESHTTFTMVNQINALRDEIEELRKRLNEMYELRDQYHLDQKKLKALEIIKEKGTLFFVDDEGNPNTTEEERKILKEVFRDE